MRIDTLKIKSDDTSMGYVIINASDFDAAVHQEFRADPTNAVTAPDAGRKGRAK